MRIVPLLCALMGCSPGGESWAESKLGAAGAKALKSEAASWLAEHAPAPPIEVARCPSPRMVFDVYPLRLVYSRVSIRARDSALIHGPSDVRCLVLAAHQATGRKRSFKEWMDVRLVDRQGAADQNVRVEGNDDELAKFLLVLPD